MIFYWLAVGILIVLWMSAEYRAYLYYQNVQLAIDVLQTVVANYDEEHAKMRELLKQVDSLSAMLDRIGVKP